MRRIKNSWLSDLWSTTQCYSCCLYVWFIVLADSSTLLFICWKIFATCSGKNMGRLCSKELVCPHNSGIYSKLFLYLAVSRQPLGHTRKVSSRLVLRVLQENVKGFPFSRIPWRFQRLSAAPGWSHQNQVECLVCISSITLLPPDFDRCCLSKQKELLFLLKLSYGLSNFFTVRTLEPQECFFLNWV